MLNTFQCQMLKDLGLDFVSSKLTKDKGFDFIAYVRYFVQICRHPCS